MMDKSDLIKPAESESGPKQLANLALMDKLPDRCDLDLAKIIYDLNGSNHSFAVKWKPIVIGRGGEHVVYRSSSDPEIVIKLDVETFEKAIAGHEDASPEKLADEIRQTTARYDRLKSFFPSALIPFKEFNLEKFPVCDNMIHWQYRENKPESYPNEVTALVSYYDYLPSLEKKEEALDLVSGYAELFENFNHSSLQKLNQCCLGQGQLGEAEIALFKERQACPSLITLIDRMSTDSNLANVLRDLIESAITYSKTTGETLDLAGGGNVFFAKDQDWKCHLPDALYPSANGRYNLCLKIVKSISQGLDIETKEANFLMNGINYVRTINGLASILGLSSHLSLVPENGLPDNLDLISIIRSTQMRK
jgi:tetratricopeptide (TPR) repeat protein